MFSGVSKCHFNRIFDQQSERLLDYGFGKASSMGEGEFAQALKRLASRLVDIPDSSLGRIPFMIVVPNGCVPLHRQYDLTLGAMSSIASYIHEDAYEICSGRQEVTDPYLAVFVNPGDGLVPDIRSFATWSAKQRRNVLTIAEGLALLRYESTILHKQSFAMAAAYCQSLNSVPIMRLGPLFPVLESLPLDQMPPGMAVPNCVARFWTNGQELA